MPRPNVAARPVCSYYPTARGCFAGDKCRYLHTDPTLAPYEQNKACRFYAQGFCKRGNQCWFKHAGNGADEAAEDKEDEEDGACGICFEEQPALYGLLNGCSHAFCLKCIRTWRDHEAKVSDIQISGMHKACPMCRQMTSFITPSSKYYREGDPRKKDVIYQYKQSMKKVPCRHFARSPPEKRFCPFGRDCFYQHLNKDGTPYTFTGGVDAMMPLSRRQRQHRADPEAFLTYIFSHRDDPLAAAVELDAFDFAGFLPEGQDDDPTALTRRGVRTFLRRYMNSLQATEEATLSVSGEQEVFGAVVTDVDAIETDHDVAVQLTPSLEALALSLETLRLSPPSEDGADQGTFLSEDPRTPANASRPGELVSGDFAWMMGGRGEVCGGESESS